MATFHWFERLRSLAGWGSEVPPPATDRTREGLVLSGGGSRASFNIGALRYLYDVAQISPTKIVGTSSGAIIAAMLAQSLDRAEQSHNLRVLEDYWLAMTGPEEMFAEQAWFTKLREQWEQFAPTMPEHDETEPVFVDANTDDPEGLVLDALESDPSTESGDFSLSGVWQMLSMIGRMSRVGPTLAASLRGAGRAASAYRPGPIVHRLLFESGFTAQAVADSGVVLRLAFVGLNSGALRFIRQDGIIVDSEDRPVSDTPFDLSLGIWASCAIPGVFRPVKLGDELYVDGGVRESVPIHACVSNLGVTTPYVVSCLPPGVHEEDFTNKDVISLMGRSITIMMDETNRDEIAWARQMGATVVEPLLDVHGPMDVANPLLHINRDYGWMRAAEEVTGATPGTTGAIIEARLALYHLLTSQDTPESEIETVRDQLRTLIANTNPALLPEGHQSWPDEIW